MRVAIVVAVGLLAAAALPGQAAQKSATTKTTASAIAKKKADAKKKKAAAAKKKAKAKKLAEAKRKKKAAKHRVKVASKPEIAVASHQGDGRVKYGRDNMPPGFAWPATPAMKTAAKACEAALDAAGVKWEPAPPEGRIADPIFVKDMVLAGIAYKSAYRKDPQAMDCQLAQTLLAVGPELHALGVREIKFGSIYRNTNVRVHGQTKNILSRHALGLAMDIKSFTDETGRVADVEMDYLKGDPLLHAIEDSVNRSTRFRIVLTPGNDPLSHSDHFHIEASVDFTAFRQ